MNTHGYFKKYFYLFYKYLIEPKDIYEENKRKEIILNIILVGIIIVSFSLYCELITSYIKSGTAYLGFSILTFTEICIFFLFLLYLSRTGKKKVSTYILIIFCVLVTYYSQFKWGTTLPSALLGDALIITMSTILIGRTFGIVISFSIGIKLILLSAFEAQKQIIPLWKTTPISINSGIQLALILLITTILSWIYSREIENSLNRALLSEKNLQEKNDSLEEIIEIRTKALKIAELEKNIQLYRFVEFGKLSAGVFHDILNPLTVISLNIEKLRFSMPEKIPGIEENITQAIQASKRMEKFVISMKKQIQSQDYISEFSVFTEIEEVLLLFNHKALKNKVKIFLNKGSEITFLGNPLKFHQFIANIISNAIDSYANSTQNFSTRSIYISVILKQVNLIITIKDRGIGMSDDILKNIFEPFFTTKEKQGIGIGLSSTKHIIEKNFNGKVIVKSIQNVGTTFVITLPHKTSRIKTTTQTPQSNTHPSQVPHTDAPL